MFGIGGGGGPGMPGIGGGGGGPPPPGIGGGSGPSKVLTFPGSCCRSHNFFSAWASFASASCLRAIASSNFWVSSSTFRSSSTRDFSARESISGCTSI